MTTVKGIFLDLLKQKDRFGCTTGLWTMCGELLTNVLALFWMGLVQKLVSLLISPKAFSLFRIWECLRKKREPFCLFVDKRLLSLFAAWRGSEGKGSFIGPFSLLLFCLWPFYLLDKKVCIAKHLFAIKFKHPNKIGTLWEAFPLLEKEKRFFSC